jgi:PiT family inorganic phosphate transporter
MDWMLIAIVAVIVLSLLFDFTNGFHDAANSVATVVATRAMPARWAPWFSAFFNFVAFFVVGTAVANTVAKVVKHDAEGVAVVFAALIAAITWNYLTWYIGMPSSSSHAIIGGLVGAGLAAGGLAAINWGVVRTAVIAIVASPVSAFAVAFVAMAGIARIQRRWSVHSDAKAFKGLQLVSAAAVSFGHGANDAQKTMGIMAASLYAGGYLGLQPDGTLEIEWWIPLLAYSAIAAGTIWGGWKIIETMGLRITTLRASSGLAANVGAVTAIFGATGMGIPISTTHAAASSVTGSGVASGQGVNLRVVAEMVLAWLVTIPATLVIG